MPTVEQILERINTEVAEKAVAEALVHHMKENMDLYEEFSDKIVESIMESPVYLDRITDAVVNTFITSIENGEIELMDLNTFDEINKKISTKISEVLMNGINAINQ